MEREQPLVPSARPVHALMLRCIRAYFETDVVPPRWSLLEAPLDVLLSEAGEHGLVPLMHSVLERMPDAPTTWRDAFKASAQRIVASNLVLGRELLAITDRLRGEGVEVLAYKGPAQAVQAYGDLGFRPFSDLDLLVRWEDLSEAIRVLESNGYDSPTRLSAELRGQEYHVACYHPEKDVLVELHWHPVPNRFALGTDIETYFERSATVDLLGRSLRTLQREDTLLLTCAHATKHHWERLEWAVTVAGLMAQPDRLDWERALQRAESAGIRRVVLTGLALATVLSGVRPPQPVATELARDRRSQALARGVLRTTLRRYRADRPTVTEPLQAIRFHMLVRDQFRDGLRYLITPRDTDRAQLSDSRAPLPVVIAARLYRLAARHLKEQVGNFRND